MAADRLATPEDLASLLERDDVDAYKAGVLVETATAIAQAAAGGQRIVAVSGDTGQIMGTTSNWLSLPQIPVTAVATVVIDGDATTEWKLFGNRIFRRHGWLSRHGCWGDPAQVVVTYDHGYAPDDQLLQLARSAVLSICQGAYGNPGGLSAESIDDYKVTYAALAGQMDASPHLIASLRRQYGRRAGVVAIGS